MNTVSCPCFKVFSKLPLEIDGQFTQTNKKQAHVLHFKNKFIILFYNFNMYFIICIFTPF